MKKQREGLLGLILITVFALCLLMTVLLAARFYQNIHTVQEEQFSGRTILSYLSTRVHQAESHGSVEVGDIGGCEALILRENDTEYVTYIYCHDGWVKELYCSALDHFGPEAGENLLRARSLTFDTVAAELLAVTCETDLGARSIRLYVPGWGGLA